MKMNLCPAQQLAHSTVRIECELPGGGMGTGTGFFYSLNKDGAKRVPVIVTNKHVVKDAAAGRLIFTLDDGEGNPKIGYKHEYRLEGFQSLWQYHPDRYVDLCAMPIADLLRSAERQGHKLFYVTFDRSLIPTASDIDDMMGMERVVMIGYPNGLSDEANNLPIFRQGMLASDYGKDWKGKKEFLIDAACFPGSSGSPVMLFDIGSYHTKKGMFISSSRIKLLGILYGGPQHTVEGEIEIVPVPMQQKAISVARIPANLGITIKSERLLDFEDMFA